MRGSISTHVAMGWYYGDGLESEPNTNAGTGADTESDTESALWGVNYPFYINLVGKWPDRVDNMYLVLILVVIVIIIIVIIMITIPQIKYLILTLVT